MKSYLSLIAITFSIASTLLCQNASAQNITVSAESSTEKSTIIMGQSADSQPIYVIDKHAMTLEDIRSMSPEDIESVYVLKGIEALEYGKIGQNGIVTIVPKIIKIDSTNPKSFNIPGTYIKVEKKPIGYVGETKLSYGKLLKALKNNKDFIYVNPTLAKEMFGKEGKNGIIVLRESGKKQPQRNPSQRRLLDTLGEQIRYARLRRDLTTVQIAERAGIARTTLVKIEKGDEGVAIGQYFRVFIALGSDITLLAKDDDLGRKLQDAQLEVKERASKNRFYD